MSNAIATIDTAFEGKALRVVLRDGEPYWVLNEVCKLLDIKHASSAARRLDADEKAAVLLKHGSQGRQVTVINESGLYALILSSRLPAARRFAKWVRSEVLPTIHRTGGYVAAPAPLPLEPPAPPVNGPRLPDLPEFSRYNQYGDRSRDTTEVTRSYAWELINQNYRREYTKLMAFMELVWRDQPYADAGAIARFAIDNPYVLDHPAIYQWVSQKPHALPKKS